MGFFSWNCRGCGESMKAPYDLPDEIEWQNRVVVHTEDHRTLIGRYDGYGRVAYTDIDSDNPDCWHFECHQAKGGPGKYIQSSDYADDQGYFYER